MDRRRWSWGHLVLALATGASGCGSGLVHVQGVVKVDGVPVEGAVVVFVRVDETGRSGVSKTDAEGRFDLTTFKTGDGVPPGQYKVLIGPPTAYPDVKMHEGMTFGELMQAYAKGREELRNKPPLPGSGIPVAYRDPARTPLRQTVPPDGAVIFDIPSEKSRTANPPTRGRKDPEAPFEPKAGK